MMLDNRGIAYEIIGTNACGNANTKRKHRSNGPHPDPGILHSGHRRCTVLEYFCLL